MNVLKISDLTPHPQNDYYFDDITGEKWKNLLESIKKNGVRTPIIVTDNMVVVSGNQRVRACKELGILTINGEVVHYANEDDVIRDLIEINVRQRGIIDDSDVKHGRRYRFLLDYYGVQHGGDRKSESRPNNSDLKTQKQIADESGISVDTMNNYIKLSEMIPEMQELLESGTVTKTTALSIARKLSPEEQKQLAEQLVGKDKVSGSEVQKYIDELKAAKEENRKLREAISGQGVENAKLRHELENAPAKETVKEVVKEIRVEVVPDDYEESKKRLKSLESENRLLAKDREDAIEKYNKADEKLKDLERSINSPKEKALRDVEGRCIDLTTAINAFLANHGGKTISKEEFSQLSKYEKQSLERATEKLRRWLDELLDEVEVTIA